ncbi:aldehyde dehydrogenase family protein [Rhodococcus triatomae]|uniref:Aldehyde dehydrogenase n=2 Tax=Rhodococcus triatomae TaxID=300028 RepID=A0A1G8JPY2_9NOCA|nr:aldehyde dehydrogenase family protein [Rhodococcus triatomae]QNG24418.1 aldehyde dehydrogenase family protein [Rhodococcus triatomae]SDI33161.1 aldehyde dehydrogenase (NAD+) [Rhodococcus triatomae]
MARNAPSSPAGAAPGSATVAEDDSMSRPTFSSLDPRTGAELAEYPVHDADEVGRAVGRAREAARWWGPLGHEGRKKWLLDWKKSIARGAEELAGIISAETGKPREDALLEVMLAVEHLDWAAKNAGKVLRRRKVSSGLVSANQASSVGYEPMGVVGVIGPWNYPVYTPMGSISYALAAGNAVVFKPSELTPGVAVWLADRWQALVPNQPVLQVVTGDGTTGAALVRAGVDKMAFTGSAATAKKVMAACAETLTPIVVEAGGKDPLLVDADADLDAAAGFAVFGALGNAGQTCAGVERVYVVDAVYDEFLNLLRDKVSALPVGKVSGVYGPMTLPGQVDVVREHVQDALDRGGRAVVGGLESIDDGYVRPIVLADVPEDSSAVCEETFGPTVVVNRVRDLDEAVTRANGTTYGLGASIFTKDQKKAMRLAEELRTGVVTIGSVLGFAGVGALPFGGVGDSGFGRIHGADGLREFSRVKSITRQKFRAPLNLLTIERKARDMKIAAAMLKMRHGR